MAVDCSQPRDCCEIVKSAVQSLAVVSVVRRMNVHTHPLSPARCRTECESSPWSRRVVLNDNLSPSYWSKGRDALSSTVNAWEVYLGAFVLPAKVTSSMPARLVILRCHLGRYLPARSKNHTLARRHSPICLSKCLSSRRGCIFFPLIPSPPCSGEVLKRLS